VEVGGERPAVLDELEDRAEVRRAMLSGSEDVEEAKNGVQLLLLSFLFTGRADYTAIDVFIYMPYIYALTD